MSHPPKNIHWVSTYSMICKTIVENRPATENKKNKNSPG